MTTAQSYPLGEHIQMTSMRVPCDGHQQKAKTFNTLIQP